MLEIIKREAAKADLVERADYYFLHSDGELSDRFLSQAESTFDLLARIPGLGGPRHDYGIDGLRSFPISKFRNHLIFYISTETELCIIRVLHGARDLSTIFSAQQE